MASSSSGPVRRAHPCHLCDKVYSRSDVLSRHLAGKHGETPNAVGRPRRNTQFSEDVDDDLRHNLSDPPGPPSRSVDFSLPVSQDILIPSLSIPHDVPDGLDQSPTWLDQLFSTATVEALGPPSSLSNEAIDLFPFDFDMFGDLGVPAPSAAASPSRYAAQLSDVVEAEEMDGQARAPELEAPMMDSSWPQAYKPSSADRDVTISRVQTQPAQIIITPRRTVTSRARDTMLTLDRQAHGRIWQRPNVQHFPSEADLTHYVNLFLSRFADYLPILDHPRGSFQIDKAAPVLLKAMAALGSVYVKGVSTEMSVALMELIRRDVTCIQECSPKYTFDVNIIQAQLIQANFQLYSGRSAALYQAGLCRSAVVAACKRRSLLDSSLSAAEYVRDLDPDVLTRAIKQDWRRRRLGWGIYLLDLQMAFFFDSSSQLSLSEIRATIPNHRSPDAPDRGTAFGEALLKLNRHGTLDETPSDFGFCILAFALYALCAQQSEMRNHFIIQSEVEPITRLAQLAALAQSVSAAPSALFLTCVGLRYHAEMRFQVPALHLQLQLAAGKSGILAQRHSARMMCSTLLQGSPAISRQILISAAQLWCTMQQTFDLPLPVLWLFDSALYLWGCLKFGNTLGDSSTLPVIIPFDSVPDNGGPVIVQGLGNLELVTPAHVLQVSADRLGMSQWGIAESYRKILVDLIREEPV